MGAWPLVGLGLALGERMTRFGVAANLVAGIALLVTLGASVAQERGQAWRGYQKQYAQLAKTRQSVRPHEVENERWDVVDRCTTCHLGHEPGAKRFAEGPFGGHPEEDAEIHQAHPLSEWGCTTCHGGQGRCLDRAAAHDRRTKLGGWGAFTHPRERCARCHPQGGQRSPRGQRGADLYLRHGCSGCHQPGRNGPGIGPDLGAVGLKGRAYLKRVLLAPDEVYPETIMPPLRFVLDEESADLGALLSLLQGFEPWPRGQERRPRVFDPTSCARCHGQDRQGPGGHRCPYLKGEASWLRCVRCHEEPRTAWDSTKTCPFLARGLLRVWSVPPAGRAMSEGPTKKHLRGGDGQRAGSVTRRAFLRQAALSGPALGMGLAASACTSPGGGAPSATLRAGALTPGQFATLRALCGRLIPADRDPGAVEVDAPLQIRSELSQPFLTGTRQRLREALDGLDGLARQRRSRSFAELSTEAQDELLRGLQTGTWEASGWQGERTLEQLLGLTYEGFWGDPVYGGNRDQLGWRTIGFHRCGPQPRASTVHRDPADHPSVRAVSHQQREFDAIVVGSGAGGAPVAQLLGEAGMSVLVLEKGPWYTKRDFVHDEIAMVRRDFFIPSAEVDPHVVFDGQGRGRRTNQGWTSRCVGGGTVHMSGFFLRLHPEDFRLRTLVGENGIPGASIADWPLSYEELAPFYGWVERMLGVSGQHGPGQVGAPFPLPPLREHPFASFLDEGARRVGMGCFHTPRAVLSRSYGGRPACTYCGYCGSYGCENDAKSSSLSALLPRALATGRVQIRPGCQAREVLVDGRGRARGVLYLDADGGEHRVEARVVVLACSAVETARLLLMSDRRRFPRGLADSSGLVGRNLLLSTFAGGEGWLPRSWATTDRHRRVLESRHPFLQRTTQSDYWIPEAGLPHPKGGTVIFMIPHLNPIATAEHLARSGRRLLWGQRLKDNLRTYYHEGRVIELECFAEFLPTPGTHVTLDPEVRDHHGLPAARLTLSQHSADRETVAHLLRRGLTLLEAAGCSAPRGVAIGRATQILQGGTCRFGRDPATAVLDTDCQAFDVPNLFVTDGSFMPTSGGVPFTLTIMANAARVAHRIVEMSSAARAGLRPIQKGLDFFVVLRFHSRLTVRATGS